MREIFPCEGAIIATDTSQSDIVSQAVRRVLVPLVRLLIRYHITFPHLSQRLKEIYLEVALRETVDSKSAPTDSRLTLLTGVHRKDVRRFREEGSPIVDDERKGMSLAAQVVATWMNTPPYCDAQGEPRLLHRLRTQGEPNFEDLVDIFSRQDMRARALYEELARNHTLSELPDGRLQLNTQAFIPGEDFAARAEFLAVSVARHIDTAVHNLDSHQTPWLERGVYANNLTAAQIAQLHDYAREQSQALLRELNAQSKRMQNQNAATNESLHRFHFGVFFNVQEQSTSPDNDTQR